MTVWIDGGMDMRWCVSCWFNHTHDTQDSNEETESNGGLARKAPGGRNGGVVSFIDPFPLCIAV